MKTRILSFLFLVALPFSGMGQISNFDSLNGYSSGMENRMTIVRDRGLDFLSFSTATETSLKVRYVDHQVDPVDERILRESDGSGIRAGFQWGLGNWAVGLDLDYESVTTNYRELDSPSPTPSSGYLKGEGYQVAASAMMHLDAWRIGFEAGFGNADFDGIRQSDAGVSAADFDSDETFASARVAYFIDLDNQWIVIPFVAYATSRMKTDGFSETGTAPDRRIVESFRIREHLGILGVRFKADWGSVRPHFSVSWIERLSGDDFRIGSTASDGSNHGIGLVETPYSGMYAIQIGFDFDLGEGWVFHPEVRYLDGGDETNWSLRAGIAYRF